MVLYIGVTIHLICINKLRIVQYDWTPMLSVHIPHHLFTIDTHCPVHIHIFAHGLLAKRFSSLLYSQVFAVRLRRWTQLHRSDIENVRSLRLQVVFHILFLFSSFFSRCIWAKINYVIRIRVRGAYKRFRIYYGFGLKNVRIIRGKKAFRTFK